MNPENATEENGLSSPITIGVISDTHGLLRPQVAQQLVACSHILHAGDIGGQEILDQLNDIAPVIAVRGNMDYDPWASSLPVIEMSEIGGAFFYMLHNLDYLDLDPVAAGIQVVISGHTHRPSLFEKDGVLFLNPGSAGHRRLNYPVSMAKIRLQEKNVQPQIIEIDV